MNLHNTMFNPDCYWRQNARNLKTFIKIYELLINNNPNYAICLSNVEISIIDLAFIKLKLGSLSV